MVKAFERNFASKHCRAALSLFVLGAMATAGVAQDVSISTDTATGINLDSYGVNPDPYDRKTAQVNTGVTVSNAAFSKTITASTGVWTLTNLGTITSTNADTVSLAFSGSVVLHKDAKVINQGSIIAGALSNAIVLQGGGSVENKAGATISAPLSAIKIGTNTGGEGYVSNYGTITQTGTSGDLVQLRYGGGVYNEVGGTISANNTSNAVSVGQGTSRTVSNSGTITNTGTSYATGVLLQGGPSTLNNLPTGTISATFNGVYASASAPLTFNNAGIISSTGPSTSARAVEATGGGDFINTGIITSASSDGLYLGRAGTVFNSGSITGAIRALNFSGNYARTLTLASGSHLNGLVQGGTGIDALILQGTGTEDISKFLSFETLTMNGDAWALSGAGGFSTSAAILAGKLSVAGTLTSPVVAVGSGGVLEVTGAVVGATTVNGGGILQGTGTVAATSIETGGSVAAGLTAGEIATLSATGNLAFASGSIYQLDANAAGAADQIAVTGATSISGGTVDVQAAAGTYAPSTQYTILTATDGVSGAFDNVTSSLAFLAPSLSYTATTVDLTLTRNGLDFGSVGGSFNQRSTGAALEALGAGAPYDAVLVLTVPEAQLAFDQLSGEIHASLKTALLEDSQTPRDAALNRLRQLSENGHSGWISAYGGYGSWSSDGNAEKFSHTTGGVIGGVDTTLDNGLRFGVLGSYGVDSFNLPARASSGNANTASLGVYAGQDWGQFALRGGLAYSHNAIKTNRAPGFLGFSDALAARYSGNTVQAFIEASYSLKAGDWMLEPFVDLAAVRLSTSAFDETGGSGALAGAASRQNLVLTTLGLRGSTYFALGSGKQATFGGVVGIRHASGKTQSDAELAFAGGGPFTIKGVPFVSDAAFLQLDVTVKVAANASLGASFVVEAGKGGSQSALGINYAMHF